MRNKTLTLLGAIALGISVLTASAAPRDTLEQSSALCRVRAGETIEAGHLVVLRAPAGLAWMANDTDSGTNVVIGRAEMGTSSNQLFYAKPGIYKWNGSGTITETSVGQKAMALNSTTVALAAVTTNDVDVGTIIRIEPDGIWVKTGL